MQYMQCHCQLQIYTKIIQEMGNDGYVNGYYLSSLRPDLFVLHPRVMDDINIFGDR